ncbi:MAG TPA: acetolactate synthase large subunit [Candidatus Saccharimonadales bacterium]|nr:acetolactate synthase large subunit [Candidatus Saccharimonadales bacterium]
MKAAQLFVASLEAAGVKHVFGVPGEENLAFVEALRESEIDLITTRDEQAAVFMAATVGRLTGRVGVALSTLGPGATNLVTGVAYAQLGGMPLMVITGQKPIKKSKQGKFQILDVVGMMRPLTKSAETIVAADRIPATIYQAVRTAESERPGAVHIELPEDVAEEESGQAPIEWQKLRRPVPDEKSINQLLELVQGASKPVIVIGSGANRKLIGKQLKNFIDKSGIPFVSTQMGKGVADESSELYLGTAALSSGDFVHQALQAADLIIMLGHDITEKPPVIARDEQKIAHLNFYPADLDKVYQPALEVIGDISYALWAVSERLQPKQYWPVEELRELRQKQLDDTLVNAGSDAFPVKPQRLVKDLRDALPREAILSLDNGMFKLWIARNYPAYEQNTVLLDNALATMGAGLGAGTAAKLLNPDKPVVVVAGDGGVMMNIADLETVIRLKLDLVIIVVNDNGYGMIKWKQASMDLADYGLSFGNPDFVKLAESFGASGHRPETAVEFKPALEKALQAGGVHIIDLPIDYSENSTLGK